MARDWTNYPTVKRFAASILAGALLVACDQAAAPGPRSSPAAGMQHDLTTGTDVPDWVKRALGFADLVPDPATALVQPEDPIDDPITVVPFEFDPFHTSLVRAFWMRGIGCPTNTTVNNGSMSSTFTDDACPTGDPKDSPGKNKGLLLVKTGPTPNFAAAGAVLNGVKGIMLTELGYDIRTGSHCGAGAPRFNVRTDVAFYFVGCNSPPATILVPFSNSWKRLRWMTPCVLGFNTSTNAFECVTGAVQSITIIFDEGTDTPSAGPPGPESGSGLAFLDNIDVNGTLVGRGPGN